MNKIPAFMFFISSLACGGLAQTVSVADFGALPDDGKCDMSALKAAVGHLKKTGAKTLRFEAGAYDLKVKTLRSASPLRFEGLDGITIEGAVNAKGEPATKIVRHYEPENDAFGSFMLFAKDCKNFALRNLVFDNSPRYSSAGEIVKKEGDRVYIKIFEGNPAFEGSIIYCSNVWDLKTKKLKHVESPTYGMNAAKSIDEYGLKFADKSDKTLMYLESPNIASKVEVGDGFSWTFGYSGVQVGMVGCDDLYVENVWTLNAVGFCIETKASRNVRGKNVKFIAPDNQLMVCGRDAWKLYACTGDVVIDGMYVEGVRWDGQNAHGSFLYFDEKLSDKSLLLFKKGGASGDIAKGSKIGFIKDPKTEVLLTVKGAKTIQGKPVKFEIEFEEKIPEWVEKGAICNVYAWCFDSYTLKNSTFKNIAGCAAILRNKNTVYENCVFDNIMYPAILIGAAFHEGEGIAPMNVAVKNCRFISSGWMPRQGIRGALGMRSAQTGEKMDFSKSYELIGGEPLFYMRNISVEGCTFEDCEIGIQATGVDGLIIKGNTFKNVGQKIVEEFNLNAEIQK